MLRAAVSITHSETHITQGEKKQTSSLSPHPTRVFYFRAGQQTVILFSRKGWKWHSNSAWLCCLHEPWSRPRQLQGEFILCRKHWGRRTPGKGTKPHSNTKVVSVWPSAVWGFFICELIFYSHFSPSTLQFLSTVNLSGFLGCIISFNILCSLITLQSSPVIYCP